MSSGRCLRFSQSLWALKGVSGLALVAFTGGLYPLSLSPHSSTTLSQGTHPPLYPTSRPGSTAGRLPTLFGATQPLSPPCSMHKAPGKGGCSQPAFNLCTSCALLGLAHHHPPPSGLAVLTPSFLIWASPKRTPLLFTPTVLSQAIAHNCCLTPVHPLCLSNTTLSLPPY
jgi:hypothetical protein